MPLAYLPGNALRVRVRVAGEMGGGLRSVSLIFCAVSKAFMCRVSTWITGRLAAVTQPVCRSTA
jgi:hypothetical protein